MTAEAPTPPNAMSVPEDLQEWEDMAPVGREFGSPDYERLEELDMLALQAKGSVLAARRWLDTPNQALDGLTPEEMAKTSEGLARVRLLLTQDI